MTVRGAIRSYNAAVRRAERETARRERERIKKYKAEMKQLELDHAEDEVEEYEDSIKTLLELHKEKLQVISWTDVLSEQEPISPVASHERERAVRLEKEGFKASFIQKIFSLDKKVLLELDRKLSVAIQDDSADFERLLKVYNSDMEEWRSSQVLAKRVLDGEKEAYLEVLQQGDSFSQLEDLQISVNLDYVNKNTFLVNLTFAGESVVPRESKELLKSGKLSVKKIPNNRINTLFQDHICSALLFVAKEIFSTLPVSTVYVNGKMKMLDSSTGHMCESVIVSAMIPKQTLQYLNLDAIDPSDAMRNFKCNMNFKAASGFEAVDEIHYGSKEVA